MTATERIVTDRQLWLTSVRREAVWRLRMRTTCWPIAGHFVDEPIATAFDDRVRLHIKEIEPADGGQWVRETVCDR